MNKLHLNYKKKYIELTRGFFSLPAISIFNRLLEKQEILTKEYFLKKSLNQKFNKKTIEILLNYFESLGLIRKITKEKYSLSKQGKFIFKRHGAMNIIYSYKDIALNFENILLGKKKSIICDRIENVYGSGKSHNRKFFKNIKSIIKKNNLSKIIDLGLGDAGFIKYLIREKIQIDYAGIDLSSQVIKKLKNEMKKSRNIICEDIFKIRKWSKKIDKNKFKKEDEIFINFMFTLHENNFINDEQVKNFLNNLNLNYPKANLIITEVFDFPSNILSNINDQSILPEFILFHKLSNQRLFYYDQLKKIIKKSNYFIHDQINYSQIKKNGYNSPTYSTFHLKPKL
jgi:hypothetical protein